MEGIPVSEYHERMKKCQALVRRKGYDAILAYSDSRYSMGQGVESGQNIRYLVGFNFSPHLIQEEDVVVPYMLGDSLIVIPKEGDASLLLSRQDPKSERAKKQVWLKDVRSVDDAFADQFVGAIHRGLATLSKQVLGGKRKARIGIGGCASHYSCNSSLTKSFTEPNLLDALTSWINFESLRVLTSCGL